MTDTQIGKILNDMLIIVDTREQKNQHILDYLDSIHVPYIEEKLDSADYSFRLPHYPELNLDKTVLVERKGSLNEICGNFTKGRERFAKEFQRVDDKQQIHLVLEDVTVNLILRGKKRSNVSPMSLLNSLISWSIAYDFKPWMVSKQDSPLLIYNIMRLGLRSELKKIQKCT